MRPHREEGRLSRERKERTRPTLELAGRHVGRVLADHLEDGPLLEALLPAVLAGIGARMERKLR